MSHTNGEPTDLSIDDVFELLADERRRHVLYEMRDEKTLQIDDLGEQIARRETGPNEDVPEDLLVRVSVDLHHHHLPKLQSAGLLEYDSRHGDVTVQPPFRLVETYLEVTERHDRR